MGSRQRTLLSVARRVGAELFGPGTDQLGIPGIGLEVEIALERIGGIPGTVQIWRASALLK